VCLIGGTYLHNKPKGGESYQFGNSKQKAANDRRGGEIHPPLGETALCIRVEKTVWEGEHQAVTRTKEGESRKNNRPDFTPYVGGDSKKTIPEKVLMIKKRSKTHGARVGN